MLVYARSKNRPYSLGPFPLETLDRDDSVLAVEAGRPKVAPTADIEPGGMLGSVTRNYRELFAGFAEEDCAPERAPGTDDPIRCTADVKGACYFMNASQVGICEIPATAWLEGVNADDHRQAIVILVEHGRVPTDQSIAAAWIAPAVTEVSDMRAAEIATNLARHIRQMALPRAPMSPVTTSSTSTGSR